MSAIADDIMQTATEIVDRMPIHTWKGDCVADVAQALQAERQRTDDLIEEVKRVLGPFSQMAGELFWRNWNASDLVLALDNPGQENRLTAGDIFAVRALLSKLGERT